MQIENKRSKKGCKNMTTKFDSKYEAITKGLYYAGMASLYEEEKGNKKKTLEEFLKSPEIKVVDGEIAQFGYVHEDCTMIEFKNSKNEVVRIATTKFRDGFDLWLIDPKSGGGIRV
jgi:hypothetical protein